MKVLVWIKNFLLTIISVPFYIAMLVLTVVIMGIEWAKAGRDTTSAVKTAVHGFKTGMKGV